MPDRREFLGAVAGAAAGAMVPADESISAEFNLGPPGIPYWRNPDGTIPTLPDDFDAEAYLAEVERREREIDAWLLANSVDKTA
jgi:hypothetical protein